MGGLPPTGGYGAALPRHWVLVSYAENTIVGLHGNFPAKNSSCFVAFDCLHEKHQIQKLLLIISKVTI